MSNILDMTFCVHCVTLENIQVLYYITVEPTMDEQCLWHHPNFLLPLDWNITDIDYVDISRLEIMKHVQFEAYCLMYI